MYKKSTYMGITNLISILLYILKQFTLYFYEKKTVPKGTVF